MVGMINGGCSHSACGKCEINNTGDYDGQNGMVIVLVIMVIIPYGDG